MGNGSETVEREEIIGNTKQYLMRACDQAMGRICPSRLMTTEGDGRRREEEEANG
jgi:hypothetical protein